VFVYLKNSTIPSS
jgi:hypothetical protein